MFKMFNPRFAWAARRCACFSSSVSNPHLKQLQGNDYLYHIGLNPAVDDLRGMFGDVRFVCVGGAVPRMEQFAHRVVQEIQPLARVQAIGKTDRYSLFKAGPVLISSHGMGAPSVSILLHEIAKLLYYAGVRATDAVWLRMGTSGGLGVEPGTVIVSQDAVDGMLRPEWRLPVLGREVSRPAPFDGAVAEAILQASRAALGADRAQLGRTMSADCFYEGQGRLDGAVCEYSDADKMTFLREAYGAGVRNIEMEALQFGAFTHHLGISAGTCCVTLLDRLRGDQVRATPGELAAWELASGSAVLAFMKQKLSA